MENILNFVASKLIVLSLNKVTNKMVLIRSLSFGNSLFAGFFNDSGAMTFDFLNMKGALGFVLPLSKKEYVETRCNKLFFVTPLGTLTSLFWGKVLVVAFRFRLYVQPLRYFHA